MITVAALCAAFAVMSGLTPWWSTRSRVAPVSVSDVATGAAGSAGATNTARSTGPSRGGWPRRRLTGKRRERLLDRAVPDLLDLFVVSVHAGLPPPEALRQIRHAVHPLIREALDDVDRRIQRGDRFVDALDALVEHLGARLLTFVSVVASNERTGLPLGPLLERIADDARLHRRHLVEADARELPVRLALPLVICTLPAFALVAIAPLVIGAISSLTSG